MECLKRRMRILSFIAIAASLTIWLYLQLTLTDGQPERVSSITVADRETFRRHAINNTVVIVPVNAGMIHLALNLVCSLSQTTFNASNIVFWTLDTQAEQLMHEKGFATYRDPTLFATSENVNRNGNAKGYRRMMIERPKFYIDFLQTGHDMLMLDADTVFFQSPLEMLTPHHADEHDLRPAVDIVYSTDAREFYQDFDAFKDPWKRGELMPPVCNGIFWMVSSDRTIGLWREMLRILHGGWRTAWYRKRRGFNDDQRGMDVMLNDGRAQLVEPLPNGILPQQIPISPNVHHSLRTRVASMLGFPSRKTISGDDSLKVRLLDQTSVANGQLLLHRHERYEQELRRLREGGQDRIAAHLNWDSYTLSKEEGAEQLGLWFLDQEGKCTLG